MEIWRKHACRKVLQVSLLQDLVKRLQSRLKFQTLFVFTQVKSWNQKKPAASLLKKLAAACLKKPAPAPVEEESSDASANILSPPPVLLEPMDAPERLYKIEDYKVTASRKTATLALRRQFGDKKQFVSFSLKSIPRETGLKIMQEALSKLHWHD